MKRQAWPVIVTAFLVGSAISIVSGAGPVGPVPGAEACTEESCIKCVQDGCDLEPDQHVHYVRTDVEERCVEYDQVPPPHCMSFSVEEYEIYNTYHVLQGTCKRINCSLGQDPGVQCTNPWILPPPAEPPPGAP
ncbi:MAG: hypothetical protein WD716_00395 [Fimbriimonadaceae bacterium]